MHQKSKYINHISMHLCIFFFKHGVCTNESRVNVFKMIFYEEKDNLCLISVLFFVFFVVVFFFFFFFFFVVVVVDSCNSNILYSGTSVGGVWIRHHYQKCSMAYENNEQTMTMLSLFIP